MGAAAAAAAAAPGLVSVLAEMCLRAVTRAGNFRPLFLSRRLLLRLRPESSQPHLSRVPNRPSGLQSFGARHHRPV